MDPVGLTTALLDRNQITLDGSQSKFAVTASFEYRGARTRFPTQIVAPEDRSMLADQII